jgi:hypothetical protein
MLRDSLPSLLYLILPWIRDRHEAPLATLSPPLVEATYAEPEAIKPNSQSCCRKERPRGSKNKAKSYGITATRCDPSQFEYTVPPSSAPAVLSRPCTESVLRT